MPLDQQGFVLPTEQVDLVLDRLRQGRARIARGWCQRALASARGEFCARGAVMVGNWESENKSAYPDTLLLSIDELFDSTSREAEKLLAKVLPVAYQGRIVLYNNVSGRTQSDILALFDRAIAARIAQP